MTGRFSGATVRWQLKPCPRDEQAAHCRVSQISTVPDDGPASRRKAATSRLLSARFASPFRSHARLERKQHVERPMLPACNRVVRRQRQSCPLSIRGGVHRHIWNDRYEHCIRLQPFIPSEWQQISLGAIVTGNERFDPRPGAIYVLNRRRISHLLRNIAYEELSCDDREALLDKRPLRPLLVDQTQGVRPLPGPELPNRTTWNRDHPHLAMKVTDVRRVGKAQITPMTDTLDSQPVLSPTLQPDSDQFVSLASPSNPQTDSLLADIAAASAGFTGSEAANVERLTQARLGVASSPVRRVAMQIGPIGGPRTPSLAAGFGMGHGPAPTRRAS